MNRGLNLPPDALEKEEKTCYLTVTHVRSENTFVLLFFASKLKSIFSQVEPEFRSEKHDYLENRTFEEYCDHVIERVEEHHHARLGINCTPNLTILRERIGLIKGWAKDKEYRDKLIDKIFLSGNKEDYKFIFQVSQYMEDFLDILGSEPVSDETITDEELESFPYFFEDLSQVIFRAKQKLNSNGEDSPPRSPNEDRQNDFDVDKERVNLLEEQKANLEKQLRKLRDKLTNTGLGSDEREDLKKQLAALQSLLRENRRRLDKEKMRNVRSPNNNKLYLAVGLGIAAGLIGLICLITLSTRRNRRQY